MNSHAFCISIYNKVFKFRKWFKYGLMAQKFQKQHALKGQKPLAQGSALGIMHKMTKRPVRAKALIMNAFTLTGRIIYNVRLPRALPWAKCNLGFQPASL